MPDSGLTTQTRLVEEDVVLSYRGEMGASDAAIATEALQQVMVHDPNLILLDLSAVENIGSTAIPVMIELITVAAAKGRRLRAFGLREHHREIFELTELSHHIDLFRDELSALDEGVGA